jgi:hypothetical protein
VLRHTKSEEGVCHAFRMSIRDYQIEVYLQVWPGGVVATDGPHGLRGMHLGVPPRMAVDGYPSLKYLTLDAVSIRER